MKVSLGRTLLLASVVWMGLAPYVWAHTDVTPQHARYLIDSTADLLVVDVREPSEFCDARGHIPGALNYPYTSGVLQARYEELPTKRPILMVCRSGRRSSEAARLLRSQGFPKVYDMTEGMNAWFWEAAPCEPAADSNMPTDP